MQAKLRVLFISDVLIRDLDGACRTMFKVLDASSFHQVEFFILSGSEIPPNFAGIRIKTMRIPFNANYRIGLFSPFSNKAINSAIVAFDPDIVHISSPSVLGGQGVKWAQSKKLPIVTIYHTHFQSYMQYYFSKSRWLQKFSNKWVKHIYRSFYNSCDLILVPSQQIKAELRQIGIQSEKLQLWVRGIDNSMFNANKKDDTYMLKLTGNAKKNIVFASRLVWEKNLQLIISFYLLLVERNMPFNLVIVGDGPVKPRLEKECPQAIFTGNLSHNELSVILASSDVFIFPSETETFGNIVLEAMASGVPVIVAPKGGHLSFVKNNYNGIVLRDNQAIHYLETIEILLNDQKLTTLFSKNALSSSLHFSWDCILEEYYKSIAALYVQAEVEEVFQNSAVLG